MVGSNGGNPFANGGNPFRGNSTDERYQFDHDFSGLPVRTPFDPLIESLGIDRMTFFENYIGGSGGENPFAGGNFSGGNFSGGNIPVFAGGGTPAFVGDNPIPTNTGGSDNNQTTGNGNWHFGSDNQTTGNGNWFFGDGNQLEFRLQQQASY